MKKWQQTGKKALSVFMAIMMLMTAWVWVAPTEASAAAAGTYDVKVRVKTTNSVDVGDDKDLTLTLNYKTNNGSGSAGTPLTHNVSYTWAETDNADNSYTFENVAGYPTSLNIDVLFAWTAAITRQWDCTIYISIYNENTKAWDLVQENSLSKNGGSWGQTDMDFTVSSIGGTPTATSIKFLSGVDSIDIPKTGGTDVSNTYTAGVYDQYGVRMTYEPTYYVRSSAPTSAQTSSNTISGVTMSSGTSSGTLKVTSDAQNTSADTKNIYVHAKYGSVYANKTVALNDQEYEFTYDKNTTDSSAVVSPSAATKKKYYNTFGDAAISGSRTGFTFINFYTTPFADSYGEALYSGTPLSSSTRYTADTKWYAAWQANKYKLTFNYKDENYTDKTHTVEKYYGQTYDMPDYPEVIEVKENGITNYKYEFKGWKVGNSLVIPPTTIPNENITYLADYEETIYYADKTNLNNAIAAANAKLAEQKYIDGGYTEESVAAFESALQQADDALDMIYFLSQQSALDLITNSLVAATNNLTTKKYIVMFVDKDGTILKDGYHFVEYGERVDVPATPVQSPDADYHYEFVEWNSNLSDGLEACNKVTDNLRYIADFAAIPHTFTETKTDSTCTADGVITYACDCGYSYTAVNPDDLAHHTWSTDYKELVPATCATKGSEAKYCTACDAIDESTRREIDELGHAFGAYTEYTPATCFGKGAEIAECSRCGAKDVKEIAQKSHSFGEEVTVDKTCTTDGYTKKVCNLCGFTNMTIDKAEGHTLTTETTDATCVSVGYTKTTCANCDYEKTEILPATGNHTFIDNWTKESEASCVAQGVEKRICTVCQSATEIRFTELAAHTEPSDWTVEVPASCDSEGRQVKNCTVCGKELEAETIGTLGHSYEAYADGTYDPTCTTAGATAQKCSRCGDINTTVINPTGHKWNAGTTTDATCTNGGYITYACENANCNETKLELIDGSAALMHDFTGTETVVTPATCTTDGEKTVKCSRCDAQTTVIIPHLGHTWGDWTVRKEATNTTPGEMTRTCSNGTCSETVEIPAGGHEFNNGTVTKAATCVEAGTMLYKCTAHENCGITLEVTIPVEQHTVAQKVVEATCTAPGSVEAYCSACNKSFDIKPTPAKAHNPVVKETVAPTCTTSGYTVYACECGTFSYNEYDASKPATGHISWTETDREDATCTEDGYIKYECSVCKAPKEEILPKTGHSFTENTDKATAATCTSLATKTYECACGASYVEYYGELAAHNYNTLVKTVPATNDSLGYEEYKCDCGLTKITILEATGTHVFIEKIADECIAPTCTENGTDVYKCSAHDNCGVKSSVLVPRLGHTVEAVYNAPTCKAAGSSAAYCTTCDTVVDSVAIPATGIHNWNEGVETTAPTCEEEGEKTYTCLVCGDTKTAAIPAKGHDLTTTVEDATCEADGKVVITCSRCDDTDVEKTIYLAKKNHDWNEGVETTAPTCEGEGVKTYTCLVCGDTKTSAIPAKGHSWSDWSVTPSTNSAKGSVSRSCQICGAKETVDIPEGNHSLVVDTDKSSDASCIAEGKLVYKCENHADCGITVTVITAKLQHKSETETVTEADCVTNGKVETRCTECGTLLVETTIPAKGHAYNNVSVKDATCTEDGVRTYTCACGDSRTEAIPAKGHSYKTTVTPATCTAPGSVVTECAVCHSDEAKTVTALPVMGHDYTGVETLIKSADCETDGSKTVQCSRCDVTTTVILPKLGHNYSDWEETPATNDTDGSWYHKCSTCGKEETLTIPAGGHNLVETENVPSKCNEKGHITYKCNAHENCSVTVTVELDYAQHTILKDNADATCTDNGHSITYCQECGVKFNDFEIPAKGHSYEGQTTLPATCIKEGVMTYTCSKCNDSYTVSVPMTQHTYEVGEEVKATCTTRGYIPYSCTTSGCTSGYEVLTEEAKGHTYKQTVSSSTCTKDGKVTLECECGDTIEADVPALGHAYVLSATTAADCTAAATETYTCSRCDASYTVSVGDKAEHTFSEWKIIAEATENTLGYKTRSCTKCGKIELEKIDAIGDHKFDKFISETPATCTDSGETVYGCSTHDDCGLTSTVVIPAHGHDMEETAAAVVPTCDSDGTTAVFTCKNGCGKVEGGEKIAALGHIYGEGEVTPATCEDEGKIVYTCGRCGGTHTAVIETNENAHQYETTVTDATCTKEGTVIAKCKLCGNETLNKTLPKLEHTWSIDKTTPASCDTDGTTYYKCGCGATKETAIPKLGHRMTAGLSVDATCTENGYTPYTCTNSGCTYTYNVYNAPAIAHNYVQVENSSTADCVNGGTVTLRCSECGKEITAAVPALGHDWSEWTTTKNPTAADEGEVERSCKRDGCNATETVPLPALGHEMVKDEVNSTAATCTAEGTDVYVCKTHTDCGYTYSVKTSKLAHDYDEGTVTEKATCTTDGEKTYTCKCGATVTELIPKTAHTLSTAVTEATCQVQGSVVTSCADCEYEIKTDLGYGVHKLTVVRESEPDCETKGIITVKCSETGCTHIADTIELPATGHDWSGEESDIVPATCETDGSKKVKCLHCEETTTVVIPATGHNYAEGESFAATCITSGYTVFACDCGSSYSRLDSQPKGHSWDEGTVKTPADCVNEGIILVKCENCEASYEKTVSKLCHSWGAWVTTKYPTASEEGEMTRACIRGGCDATETAVIPALGGGNVTYTVTFVADGEVVAVQTVNHGSDATAPVISKASDANGHYSYIWDTDFTNVTDNLTVTAIFTLAGHTYGSWVTDRESTCQANGSQHRSCTVCGYTETASLTLADHNYSVVVGEKAPTCTENGYKDVVCSVCGKAEKQTIKRLGHIMTYHERVYETCDSEGLLAHFSCSRCGKNFEDRQGNFELSKVVVNKMYHSFVIVEGFAPTCTSDGATTYKHCTVCGMTEVSVPIPALGHVDANGDHYCDRCSSAYMDGGQIVCTCNCHKVGFFNELIYKILRFFWQLFGKNKTCTCGAIHY